MKFRFIWIGKTRDKNYRALQDEYMQRLSHFVKCEVIEIRDSAPHDTKETEGKRIFEKLNRTSFVCLLDVVGKSLSSPDLAQEIEKWQHKGLKDVSFVIGGADGASAEVATRADFRL